MHRLRHGLIAFLSAVAVCLALSSSAQTPKAPANFRVSASPISLSVSGLHIVGNQIVNGAGQAVQLRGVNFDGTEYMCRVGNFGDIWDPTATGEASAQTPPGTKALNALKAWGINALRIPLNESCALGINGAVTGGPTYVNSIVAATNFFTSNGFAVFWDLQWVGPGAQLAGNICNNQFAPLPDLDHAVDFWTLFGNLAKANSSVIIDPYNEPWPENVVDTPAAWLATSKGQALDGSQYVVGPGNTGGSCNFTYNAVGMQALVNAIRATGATNIIDIPGPEFANSLTSWLQPQYRISDTLNPPQIAAAVHIYQGQVCSSTACYDSVLAPVMAQVPLVMEELGERDCQGGFIGPTMTWLDAKGGHYLGWSWNTYDCAGYPALISATDGTPSAFGIVLRDHLLTVRGQSPPAQVPVPYFNNGAFPVGIAIGASSTITANDGTKYFPDTVTATGLSTQTTSQFGFAMDPYTTADTITGTPDPALYAHGRSGCCAQWVFSLPNGSYTLTLGMAPTSSANAGQYGQDQYIQNQVLDGCVWSSTPSSAPGGCGLTGANPAIDVAQTVTYNNVLVSNQTLSVKVGASFGDNRTTILSSIKIAQQSVAAVPPVPTGLVATPSNNQVSLSWTASSGATSYNVLRGTAARGFFKQIGLATSTSYVDTTVTNGRTYYYILSAANAGGTSAKTTAVSATPALAIPSVPSNVAATAGNAQVSLSWTASSGATGYKVKRSTTNGSGYTQVATPSSSPYTDTGLTNGTAYYYVVTAGNGSGDSANSAQVSATPIVGGGTSVWSNVTPGGISLDPNLACGNFGVETVGADPTHPGTVYLEAHCQGIFKSTDYGQSWSGPVNTGTNGANVTNCAGGITVVPTAGAPIIFESCIRGSTGLWKSTDGGINWTSLNLVPPLPTGRPDVYPVSVDPYNVNHVLANGHEQNFLIESMDGGATWTNKTMPINTNGGTAFTFFIDTGNPATTAKTWLWIAQGVGGSDGTRRTSDGAVTWAKVDNNEHPHGDSQIYQPDKSGIVFMAGIYSAGGWGVERSTDYGQTWTHVGNGTAESVVWGTSKNVYSMYGWSINGSVGPDFQLAPQPATGTWTQPTSGVPSSFNGGPHQIAVVNDGVHSIFVCACGLSGVWRYIEP